MVLSGQTRERMGEVFKPILGMSFANPCEFHSASAPGARMDDLSPHHAGAQP